MLTIKQTLITFFEQVAQKDKSQLKKINQEAYFNLDEERWCFTLPALHLFLQHQYDNFSCIEYKRFRQLIFSSPINQRVKLYGAEIIITNNLSKVDKSGYALVWPPKI